MNKVIRWCFFLYTACLADLLYAQSSYPAEMSSRLDGAYTKYFRYFDPTGSGMPRNSVRSCNGVVGIETFRYYEGDVDGCGTAFFIRTRRNDGKICLITAGHVIDQLKIDPEIGDKISFEIYLKYFGKDNNGYSQTTSGIHATVIDAVLAGYQLEPELLPGSNVPTAVDYAILLVDKEVLPAKIVTALGYDLNTEPSATQHYYTLGHSHASPMRIADDPAFISADHDFLVKLRGSGNNNTAGGHSGAPVFYKNETGNTDAVAGIMIQAWEKDQYIPERELIGDDRLMPVGYSPTIGYFRLSFIADEIREFAQAAAGAAQTSTSDPFLESEEVDNIANWNAFQVAASASNLADLNGISSTKYATENPGSKLVRAKSLTMNFAYLPASSSQNMVTKCLTSQANLENGFSFTAGSNTEFSIYSVVPEPASTAISRSTTDTAMEQSEAMPDQYDLAGGYVYPNPSHTGIFTAVLTGNAAASQENYVLKVFTSTGKLVYESPVTPDTQIRFDIHKWPPGTYLAIIKNESGQILLRRQLLYVAY